MADDFIPIGLRLNFNKNNTGLRNSLDCDGGNTTAKVSQCRGASGGVFNIEGSKTFTAVTNQDWKVPAPDVIGSGIHIVRGYDKAIFRSNVTDSQFPLEIWSNLTATNRSALGLGIRSSVLSSLLDVGVIPSTEIGLYFGSRSVERPDNGELVIGGYNPDRVAGKFKDFPVGANYGVGEPCPLQVLLKDVLVTNDNGVSQSIMSDSGSRVPACINPAENSFTFTKAMYNSWANVTQKPSNPPLDGSKNYTDQTYPLNSEPYMKELVIVLEGDYRITIPHYELVTPERGNNAQGLYEITNSSRLASAVTIGDAFTYPVLGGVFLSQNYLRVDYNRKIFSLAPAVTTPLGDGQSTIVSTCNAPPPSIPVAPGSKKLGAGAIAGIVVGSIAVVAIVASLVAFFFLKGKRAQKTRPETMEMSTNWTYGGTSKTHSVSMMEESSTHGASPISASTAVAPYRLSGTHYTQPQEAHEMYAGPSDIIEYTNAPPPIQDIK
jgi:hypothetical protein